MKRFLPFLIIIAVLGAGLGAAWYLMKRSAQSSSGGSAGGNPVKPGVSPDAAVATNASPGANPPHARGPNNAPVTLEEFGDFECPPCGQTHPILIKLQGDYGDRLRVIFREFPLTPPHVHALAAAQAAEAAGLQGKFFEMHDLLYENQKSWKEAFDTRPIFEGYARQIGLDVERFKTDQTGEIVARRITLDGSRGHSLGVKGTPTIFINGVEIPFAQVTPDGLHAAIEKALAANNRATSLGPRASRPHERAARTGRS